MYRAPLHRPARSCPRWTCTLLVALAVASAAPAAAQRRTPTLSADPVSGLLPRVPRVRGPLRIAVVHPKAESQVDAADSTFVFGSVGSGDARVSVAGQPARVADNGAWIAWVRLPDDDRSEIVVEATRGADSARLVVPVRRVPRFVPPRDGPWVDTLSFEPRGRLWRSAGSEVAVRVRAAPGASLLLLLPGGARVPLVPTGEWAARPDGVLAFDRDDARRRTLVAGDRVAGRFRAQAIGRHPGGLFSDDAPSSDAPPAVLLAVIGTDTARYEWPMRVGLLPETPQLVQLDDDPTAAGGTDSIIVGRAVRGGSYHWFFRTGTRAVVAAREDDDLLLQLSEGHQAWVAHREARALPVGLPHPTAVIGSPALTSDATSLAMRIPWTVPVPVQVEERRDGLRLVFHSARGDVDWIRYGGSDPLVRRISWQQRSADRVEVEIELTQPLWGWRASTADGDYRLELRRPPRIARGQPLAGRLIVVDPGHPPAGATGPTGLREADANLAIAMQLVPLLRAAGARVLLTRAADTAVSLGDRVAVAERANADLLISVHNNALPDGVEPFSNSGTSVYYNHVAALPLAMRVQESLAAALGVRSLGVAQGDLALVRGTWVPAILTEGLFLMIPEHEAALRTRAGQLRYARGVLMGVERFLRESAASR